MTASALARAICCEGNPCMRPDSCDAGREYRVPISPVKAAAAVLALLRQHEKRAMKDDAEGAR